MIVEVTYLNGTVERFITEDRDLTHPVCFLVDGKFSDDDRFSVAIPWAVIRKVERIS